MPTCAVTQHSASHPNARQRVPARSRWRGLWPRGADRTRDGEQERRDPIAWLAIHDAWLLCPDPRAQGAALMRFRAPTMDR